MKNLKEVLDRHSLWQQGEPGGEQADLRERDLRGEDLRSVNLENADLRGAVLSGADLRWANLTHADLRRADFQRAFFYSADLQGADLRKANLQGADLRGADLRRVNMDGVDLAVYAQGSYVAYITSRDIRIGCQYHSASRWANFSDQQIKVMAPDALEYWRDNRSIIIGILKNLQLKFPLAVLDSVK